MEKQKYVLSIFTIVLITMLASCESFVQVPAQGALSDETVTNKEGLEKLLNGAYARLDGIVPGTGSGWASAPNNWIYGSIAGGQSHKGSFGGDQPGINPIENFTAGSSNGFFDNRWKSLYDGVSKANSVLETASDISDISETEKNNIIAQARFLRGHYYFELKKMFNQVPWIDENTPNVNQPNDENIWPNIEADFEFAYNNLPSTQDQVARVNKWAAGAYLGKSYLFQEKYTEARTVFDNVILGGETTNGLKYGLTEKFQDNFRCTTENNKESVFAIQMTAEDGTGTIFNSNEGTKLNFPGGNAPFRRNGGFNQPSIDLVNSYRTNASGLPIIHGYNEQPIKNTMGISSDESFTPDEGNIDPRLDWTVGRRGIPFLDWGYYPGLDWVLTPSYGGPYGPKKNSYWQATQDQCVNQNSWAPGTGRNILIIRFAHVLLMASEVEANMGALNKAQTYVNRVRERAANPNTWVYDYNNQSNPMEGFSDTPAANYVISTYPSGYFSQIGQAEALRAIYFESKLELAMEGHRFFNLSRWGIAAEMLNDYFDYEGSKVTGVQGAEFEEGKNEYFPIPQAQIDLSYDGNNYLLKQNPGYN